MPLQAREITKPNFRWVHATDPTRADLEKLSEQVEIPASFVRDCLEPEHLPKFERRGPSDQLILRAYDAEAGKKADTIQGLTRKLALFFSPKFVLSVTRKEQAFVDLLGSEVAQNGTYTAGKTVSELFLAVVRTYEPAVAEAVEGFEGFESELFKPSARSRLSHGYKIKRRATLLRRMLRMLRDSAQDWQNYAQEKEGVDFPRIKSRIDKLIFQLDEVQENINNLLALQVSIASQRTNEVMRILTILSVVFMPLNFIAGVFGMNFEKMPWVQEQSGFLFSIALMGVAGALVLAWFRYKGWLKRS